MKRCFVFALALVFAVFLLPTSVKAAENDEFSDEIQALEDALPDDTKDSLNELDLGSVDSVIENGVDLSRLTSYLVSLVAENMGAPLSSLLIMLSAVILTSLAQAYTFSLRYTDTKEISGVVVALFVASVAVVPVAELSGDAVTVISGSTAVMLVYLPIMAGLMAFSGRAISSAGYYSAVVLSAQLLSWLSSAVLAPLLNIGLVLSVTSGVCSRLHITGLVELVNKGFKYILTFTTAIFVGVVGLNSALSSATDGLAGKAVKLTLSSFIPMVGSSISEAYSSIKSSMNLLRSGMGVFVIISLFVSFAPLLLRTLLWSLTVNLSRSASEILGVGSAVSALGVISSYLSSLRAMLLCVMTAFVISSAIIINVGGSV